jgi:ketosteroid isomerase-like protein
VDAGRTALARGLDRDLSQAGEISFRFETPQISRLGDVAWLAARASVTAEIEGALLTLPGRVTAVLVHQGGRWAIAQSHFSMPAADQAEGQPFPSAARA